MSVLSSLIPPDIWSSERVRQLALDQREQQYRRTDRLFVRLLAVECVAGIAAALWISPYAWAGSNREVHPHVWSALVLGGLIISLPIWLAWAYPGRALTRQVIGIAQLLMSGLLIHLTQGRIETHFHVFGSLAFLAFYRDWRVLITASAVTAFDHLVRGYVWPLSIYGVELYSPWRWLEHTAWVIFLDIFLILACWQSNHETNAIAERQYELEVAHDELEARVRVRTAELERVNQTLQLEVSERKRARSALQLSEFSVGNASLPTLWISRDARIQRVNRAACDLLGYTEAELLSLAIPDLDPDFPAERWPAHWQELRERQRMRFQTRQRHKSGRIIPVEVDLNWFEFEGQEYNFAFVRDITDQQRNQELLDRRAADVQAQRLAALNLAQDAEDARQQAQHSQERLNLSLKSSGVGTWNWNITENSIYWDEYLHPLFGLPPGTFGGTFEAFEALLDPTERERVQREITDSIEHDTEYDSEFRVVWPDGSVHVLAARGKVYRDDAGQALRMTGVCWDVTESRKVRETVARQAQELARSNKELEQFAYIASHDLQEPLRKVQSFGSMIETAAGTTLSTDAHDYLQRMRNAAGRMQQFINDLLTYSRVATQAKPFESVDLHRVAREVLGDLEARIQSTAGRVQIGDLPTLDADPLQMRQLLQNLIGNALKFHRPEVPPVVTVQSRSVTLDAGTSTERPAYEITVQDNGIGFDEKYLVKLFAPFSRLHGRAEYEGTGIGLAICKKIVDRHGGTITARSVPGEGTRFIATLPRDQATGVPKHAL